MKILLAEDDANISTIAKMTLEQIGGHTVEVATDGTMALEKAVGGSYDLVMLDEMMPGMNGVAVCEEYQKTKPDAAPVIFMSANSAQKSLSNFQRLGIGFIPKPFDPTQLNQQIDQILEGKRQ